MNTTVHAEPIGRLRRALSNHMSVILQYHDLATLPFDKPVLSFAEGLRACPVPDTGANGINQNFPDISVSA